MEKKILELEKSLFKVRYMSDVDYLNKVIASDYLEIGKSGKIIDKTDVIDELSKLMQDRNITIYNYTCKQLDTNTFIVNYITKSGEDDIFRTSIWIRNEHEFKIIFHQASLYKEQVELIEY